jgi:hypothetical protein
VFLTPLINCTEFIFISVGVITMDCENLGNKASTRAAVEMYYYIERVADIALDRPIRELNSALENATCKSGKTLPRRCCVDCREAARVTCIEKLQEIESLASTYFTKDDPVGAVAKGRFQ